MNKNIGGLSGLSKQDQLIRSEILKAGMVTHEIHLKYFPSMTPSEIRDKLESLALDRHMRLCLHSVEVLIIYYDCKAKPHYLIPRRPQGVDFTDKPIYGLAGGTCKDAYETPTQAAVRLLSFKYGININEEDLNLHGEPDVHLHTYEGNGDQCEFIAYRYVVVFEKGKPKMHIDPNYADEMGNFTNENQPNADEVLATQISFIDEMIATFG